MLWPRVSVWLFSLISSCCIRPALLRTRPTLLFFAWHGVSDLLLVYFFFL
jgi:hypothetical protein